MNYKLLRLPAVIKKTGLSKATIYALIKQNQFPQPVRLIPEGRAVAWRADFIDEWIESRQLSNSSDKVVGETEA